jgi:hypothetical protein
MSASLHSYFTPYKPQRSEIESRMSLARFGFRDDLSRGDVGRQSKDAEAALLHPKNRTAQGRISHPFLGVK